MSMIKNLIMFLEHDCEIEFQCLSKIVGKFAFFHGHDRKLNKNPKA